MTEISDESGKPRETFVFWATGFEMACPVGPMMFHCAWAVPYRTLHWLMKLTELEMADAPLEPLEKCNFPLPHQQNANGLLNRMDAQHAVLREFDGDASHFHDQHHIPQQMHKVTQGYPGPRVMDVDGTTNGHITQMGDPAYDIAQLYTDLYLVG